MECSVCTDSINKTTRKPVECLHCGYMACQSCVKRFLLENTVVPKCMSCKAEWNMEFIRSKLPRSFMDKEYREHQKGALLVEAEANLGDLQEGVRRQIRMEELENLRKELKIEKRRIEQNIQEVQNEMWRLQNGGATQAYDRPRHEFFMACPSSECRGRLSTSYKCGLCAHYFCPDCHGDKGLERENEGHTCKEDDVKTVEMLRKNTRPCPKCHMGIFKTEGCDQMWCTQCHTCFSWRSGNILNGQIHNPHFYEWQRQQNGGVAPRVQGDIPCGGIPTLWNLERKLRVLRLSPIGHPTEYLMSIHRLITHLEGVTMVSARRKMNNRTTVQTTSGIQYLRNLINKETWVNALYRSNRDAEKYRRYYQVLETLVFNVSEILRMFITTEEMTPKSAVNNCEKVLEFANEEILRMNKQYNVNFRIMNAHMSTGDL